MGGFVATHSKGNFGGSAFSLIRLYLLPLNRGGTIHWVDRRVNWTFCNWTASPQGFSADMVTPNIGSDRHPMHRVTQHKDIRDGGRYTFISQSYKSKTSVPNFCSNPSHISRSHSKRAMSWSASNWPPFDKPILQEAKISSKYI